MSPLHAHSVALAVGALALLPGCGSSTPPRWVPLAPLLHDDAQDGLTRLPWRGRELELQAQGGEVTLHLPLQRSDWEFEAKRGVWRAALGLDVPHLTRIEAIELRTPAGPVPRGELTRIARGEPLHGFVHWDGDLAFGGDEPPAQAVLVCPLLRDESPRPGGGARARTFSGEGPLLLPGMRARGTVAIPPDSTLRFCLALEPLLRGGATRVTFRVRQDGQSVFERELVAGRDPALVWLSVTLEERAQAELSFEVEGDLALAAFLDPTLGPREIGRPGARPWAEARPDLLLFLADTFRADNLSAYGGRHGAAPALDALAQESLLFSNARSVAPWTLPSHATLFSGFFPHQVGIDKQGGAVPAEVETVIEALARAGYRTAAVTDAGLVSARFGLGQGFQVFSERKRELSEILAEARAFLAADDGRPTFLFAHSYRVHWPYESSAETRRELGERLQLSGEAGVLLEQALAEARAQGLTRARRIPDLEHLQATPRFLALSAQLRSQYLGGVADLDREVGAFADELERQGFFAHGCLLFTSDHGEGFGEHGALFHGRRLHEEQTRIPLFLKGRGITAGTVAHPSSLVDVAPTLAALAGLAPDPRWPGRSLLALDGNRATYAFECAARSDSSSSVLDGGRKVLVPEEPEGVRAGTLFEAYDLTRDPGELEDQARGEARWPEEHLRAHAAELLRWMEPLVRPVEVELDSEKAAELEHLGY